MECRLKEMCITRRSGRTLAFMDRETNEVHVVSDIREFYKLYHNQEVFVISRLPRGNRFNADYLVKGNNTIIK